MTYKEQVMQLERQLSVAQHALMDQERVINQQRETVRVIAEGNRINAETALKAINETDDRYVQEAKKRQAANEHMLALEKCITNQRKQLREIAEKLEAMKTWYGIVRTAGQRLGICR